MPTSIQITKAEGTLFFGNRELPLINSEVFDSLVFRLIQALQSAGDNTLVRRFSNETVQLPYQWRKYSKVEPRHLIFCVETGLLIWLQGILLKYAVDVGLAGTSLFEPRYVKGREVVDELARFADFFSEDTLGGSSYSWWWKTDDCVASDVWDLVGKSLSLSKIDGLDGDLASNLYMICFPPEIRKSLGEFYTDRRIAEYILDCVGYIPQQKGNFRIPLSDQNLIDPACGAGSFLIPALGRYFRDFLTHQKWISDAILNLVRHKRIVGVDVNPFACALSRLSYIGFLIPYLLRAKVEQGHLPLISHIPIIQADVLFNIKEQVEDNSFSYVVGNPPYVRIQRLNVNGSKQHYVQSFDSAVGRFDLYSLFIERGLQLLKPNGKLGYITSNKFMTTNAGKGVRKVISERATMKHLFDLSDTKVFTAAVLPCIIILENCKSEGQTFPFVLLRETRYDANHRNTEDVFSHLQGHIFESFYQEKINLPSKSTRKVSFDFRIIQSLQPEGNGDFWHFLSPQEQEVIDAIEGNHLVSLGKVAKITSGLKTTADNVFIHPMTESFIKNHKLETDLIYPFIQARNIDRWTIRWTGTKEKSDTYVLYPHLTKGRKVVPANLDDYPNAAAYLKSHYERLSKRDYLIEAGRKWYEIWVQQKPETFQQPFKIVTPDIKTRNTFALDTRGFMSGSSCFAILPKKQAKADSYYLLGLLNSELLEFYHKVKASTFIYAGRYRYWTSYIQDYPIIDCCLGERKFERTWLEIEPQISNVCDLRIQNETMLYGDIPVSVSSDVCPVSLFQFALQREIVFEVEGILTSDASQLHRLETRLNDLVYHLYQIDDSLRNVVANVVRA